MESGKLWIFWIFNTQKDFFDIIKCHQNFTYSWGLKSFLMWPGIISPSLVYIQKGVPKGFQISKRIFTDNFQKNVLFAIPFSILETSTQFSKCPRIPKWQHCLILLIWPQEQYPFIKIIQYERQDLQNFCRTRSSKSNGFKHLWSIKSISLINLFKIFGKVSRI